MAETIPVRSEIHEEDTWDLSGLFTDPAAWDERLKRVFRPDQPSE